jgi:hypothetical protein
LGGRSGDIAGILRAPEPDHFHLSTSGGGRHIRFSVTTTYAREAETKLKKLRKHGGDFQQ